MGPVTDGILLIDKGIGETSHSVVKKIRTVFRRYHRKLKVGHAGTLDPFATGLLIVLVGQGTKLAPFIVPGEKVYLATLELGVETDTLDLTGKVVAANEVPDVNLQTVREKAAQFVGTSYQVPPAYSAVRYKGKRAYQLARKGLPVHLEGRKITVHSLQILSLDVPQITMRIRCSSGTYVRRLASDLGNALGPGGHLRSLRRIKSGPFDVKDAISSEEIGTSVQKQALSERVIPMREAIPSMKEVTVQEAFAEKVQRGYQPLWEELTDVCDGRSDIRPDLPDGRIKLVSGNRLIAILNVGPEDGKGHGRVKIERVFSS